MFATLAVGPILPTLLLIVMWVLWAMYWVVTARNAKPDKRREPPSAGLLWYATTAVCTVLMLVPGVLPPPLYMRALPVEPALFWLGAIIAGCGLWFATLARIALGDNWSAWVTLKNGHVLVRTGPYRLVRHPIYSGLLLAVLGSAILIGAWYMVIILVLLTAAVLHKIQAEERYMADEFGPAYDEYRVAVPALVPRLGGR